MRTAVFLLTGDNMFAVLVAEILIKVVCAVGGVRVGELSGWLELVRDSDAGAISR